MSATETHTASRMRARASLRTELTSNGGGTGSTRIAVLRSKAPLKLRPAFAHASEPLVADVPGLAHVCLAAAAAGPMGGDELHLEIEVGAGSALVLTEASSTLLLPGRDGARSRLVVRIRVDADASFVWLPEPVIAARGCHHWNDVTVELASSARVLLREELILGRRGEAPGDVRQTLRVRREDRTLLAQDLHLGPGTVAGPAVIGRHRAVGTMLVVDPALADMGPTPLPEDGVLLPLACGRAVLAQGLSADSLGLRRQLDAALTVLGPPWDPGRRPNKATTKPNKETR